MAGSGSRLLWRLASLEPAGRKVWIWVWLEASSFFDFCPSRHGQGRAPGRVVGGSVRLSNMVVSLNRGDPPQFFPRILIMGTPTKVPLILGNPPYVSRSGNAYGTGAPSPAGRLLAPDSTAPNSFSLGFRV